MLAYLYLKENVPVFYIFINVTRKTLKNRKTIFILQLINCDVHIKIYSLNLMKWIIFNSKLTNAYNLIYIQSLTKLNCDEGNPDLSCVVHQGGS